MDYSPIHQHMQATVRLLGFAPLLLVSSFALLITVLAASVCAFASPAVAETAPKYRLAISFDLSRNELTGTAQIAIPAGEELSLFTGSLKITGNVLKRQDGSTQSITLPSSASFLVPAAAQDRELMLSYSAQFTEDTDNLISTEGITLLDGWHPVPDKRMLFSLSARLPQNFTAIVEADTFPLSVKGETVTATFNQPLKTLHFAAAPYAVSSLEVRDQLKVHALFFPEDSALAHSYLSKARDYILRYEREVGPFPYSHYAIVANRLPTGLGMPTFTLLGQAVLRLPFIKDTSLGHEILHSWFGNRVEVAYEQGNWCEGLTSYLADHAFRADAGDGTGYRKEALLNYQSYVHESNRMPLAAFTNASHNQPMAKARRAVGYSRGMMLFHELRMRLGDELFFEGIRTFYREFQGETASWHDIRDVFSTTSGEDLNRFFKERLTRDDMPALAVEDITLRSLTDGNILRFNLSQNSEQPYQLQVPVRVTTSQGKFWFTITSESKSQDVILELDSPPLNFSIDPEYSLFRTLTTEEQPAVWSQFMGADNKLVVLADADLADTYQPLIDRFGDGNWSLQNDAKTSNSQLAESDLLFLGLEGGHAQSLFGTLQHPAGGFTLEVRPNPLNHEHVAVLVSSGDASQTASTASRLSHYGKYSFLHFEDGRIKTRRIADSEQGINFTLEQLPQGGATSNLQSFSTIADQLSEKDVIYLGEQHTSMSDHRLQLRLIEAIYARSPDIAIGMEMFPYTSQEALNRYTLQDSEMSEKEFLKASGYFSVWRYDYRYFQDIFTFARNNRIPVIGLNLPRETVSTVYSSGGTDALSKEVRAGLPQERDLSLPGYARQLREMQSIHRQGGHGTGNVSGFIQAQSLWDETMAEMVAGQLKKFPGRKLIVLAGSQHTRKDFGIPPRVARRASVDQASVLNIFNGSTPANLTDIADYFFLVEPLELPEPAKIGISISEPTTTDGSFLTISAFNPASKADEAGLRINDSILAIDEFPIRSMEDVRIALFDSLPGDVVRLEISRQENGFAKEMVFEVELIQPVLEKPHP